MDNTLPLNDIHLPEALSWWPPAIGWWLVLFFIVVAFIVVRIYMKARRSPARMLMKSAQSLLDEIKHNTELTELEKLQQLSNWLRRVSISHSDRAQVASLTGINWLAYLDSSMEGTPFSEGQGHYLADAHFRQHAPDGLDIDALTMLCEQWLRRQRS